MMKPMFPKERKALIKIIQGECNINPATLSDAELRQNAQRILSARTLKKAGITGHSIGNGKKRSRKIERKKDKKSFSKSNSNYILNYKTNSQ